MNTASKNTSALFFLICTGLFLSSLGCDQPFEPLKENGRFNFTMYGVLDLSADTQWVRVSPIRESIYSTPEPIDATVTLTRKSTGETEVLQDSLFRLSQNRYVWNYWTDTPLHPEEEYTVRAEDSDGRYSQGTAYVPQNFETPSVDYNDSNQSCRVIIDGTVKRIVVAQIIYSLVVNYPTSQSFHDHYPISHLDDISTFHTGDYIINARDLSDIADDFSVNTSQINIINGSVSIVSGGPNWPDSADASSGIIDLPNSVSNVEKGLGIITGVVSKEIPLISD